MPFIPFFPCNSRYISWHIVSIRSTLTTHLSSTFSSLLTLHFIELMTWKIKTPVMRPMRITRSHEAVIFLVDMLKGTWQRRIGWRLRLYPSRPVTFSCLHSPSGEYIKDYRLCSLPHIGRGLNRYRWWPKVIQKYEGRKQSYLVPGLLLDDGGSVVAHVRCTWPKLFLNETII